MHFTRSIVAIAASAPFAFSLSRIPESVPQQFLFPPSTPIDIPLLGFGTWNLSPNEHNASAAVSYAIQTGYRHIDCAAAYRNEKDVGRGIRDGLEKAGLEREDIWVTSKLWNNMHDPAQVEQALDQTLLDLGLPYLDLYLMHWPVAELPGGEKVISFLPTWEAMSILPPKGKVRHIGISNFSPAQLHTLLSAPASPVPFAHQMELHPYLPQTAWLQYHAQHGIHVTAYSPLGNVNPTYDSRHGEVEALLKNEAVLSIAHKRGCSPAQVVLKWGLSRSTSVIPKSQHRERIEENFGTWECEIEFVDFEALEKVGENPVRFNNPSGSWGVGLYEGLQDS